MRFDNELLAHAGLEALLLEAGGAGDTTDDLCKDRLAHAGLPLLEGGATDFGFGVLTKDRFAQGDLLLLDGGTTGFDSGVLTEERFAQAGLLLLAGFGASGVLGGTERFATDRLVHDGLPLLLVSEPVVDRVSDALG